MLTQDTYTYPGKLISNFILEEDVLCNIDLNISGITYYNDDDIFLYCVFRQNRYPAATITITAVRGM